MDEMNWKDFEDSLKELGSKPFKKMSMEKMDEWLDEQRRTSEKMEKAFRVSQEDLNLRFTI